MNSTPWGKPHNITEHAPGIQEVSCGRHGGYKLDRARNAAVHEAARKAGGWYEEDCEWCWVALTFPELFPELLPFAVSTAKNYYPDTYTKVTGEPVEMCESRELQKRAFETASKGCYVARSGYGSWASWVPVGMVGVYAEKSLLEYGYFLVPADEYRSRSSCGFIIDETRHVRVPNPNQ